MNNHSNRRRRAFQIHHLPFWTAAVALLVMLGGCGSAGYTLTGKVVRGAFTDIEVVSKDDPHLDDAGVGDVRILIHRDPNTLKQELITTGRSRPDGTFEIPISAFVAGWMDETWLIQVERGGYLSGDNIIRLPGMGKRLLITLAEGTSVPHQQKENLWDEYEKYK